MRDKSLKNSSDKESPRKRTSSPRSQRVWESTKSSWNNDTTKWLGLSRCYLDRKSKTDEFLKSSPSSTTSSKRRIRSEKRRN